MLCPLNFCAVMNLCISGQLGVCMSMSNLKRPCFVADRGDVTRILWSHILVSTVYRTVHSVTSIVTHGSQQPIAWSLDDATRFDFV